MLLMTLLSLIQLLMLSWTQADDYVLPLWDWPYESFGHFPGADDSREDGNKGYLDSLNRNPYSSSHYNSHWQVGHQLRPHSGLVNPYSHLSGQFVNPLVLRGILHGDDSNEGQDGAGWNRLFNLDNIQSHFDSSENNNKWKWTLNLPDLTVDSDSRHADENVLSLLGKAFAGVDSSEETFWGDKGGGFKLPNGHGGYDRGGSSKDGSVGQLDRGGGQGLDCDETSREYILPWLPNRSSSSKTTSYPAGTTLVNGRRTTARARWTPQNTATRRKTTSDRLTTVTRSTISPVQTNSSPSSTARPNTPSPATKKQTTAIITEQQRPASTTTTKKPRTAATTKIAPTSTNTKKPNTSARRSTARIKTTTERRTTASSKIPKTITTERRTTASSKIPKTTTTATKTPEITTTPTKLTSVATQRIRSTSTATKKPTKTSTTTIKSTTTSSPTIKPRTTSTTATIKPTTTSTTTTTTTKKPTTSSTTTTTIKPRTISTTTTTKMTTTTSTTTTTIKPRTTTTTIITTTPQPSTTSKPVVPEICQGSDAINGVSYKSHWSDCDKFIQCVPASDGSTAVFLRTCTNGTLWDQGIQACVDADLVDCPYDRCRTPGLERYPSATNCRSYWICQDGKSKPACCPPGYSYDNIRGCIPDARCLEDCTNGPITQNVCDRRAVPEKPLMFEQYDLGRGWTLVSCAPGTVYNQITCHCSGEDGATPPEIECYPELYIPFNGNIKDESGNNNYLQVDGVKVVDGTGYFDGKSLIRVPRFSNLDFGNTVIIKLRYREDGGGKIGANGPPQALVANGDCNNPSSLYLVTDQGHLDVGLRTQDGSNASVSLPSNDVGWKEAALMVDKHVLLGSLNGISHQTLFTGSIEPSKCALQIGRGTEFAHFHGYMDDITVYLCKPKGFI